MLENGDNVEICYLDFAKAYDKLDHRIMITKLSKMGIKGKNLGWITNWLTPRKQRVRINSSLSSWNDVLSGIPQGSIFGPLLFIIYIWDLYINDFMCPETITKIWKYVDDTKVIGRICNDSDFQNYQNTLDSVYQWQQNNNMMCSSLYGTTGSHQRKIYYLHLGMKTL